MAGLTRRDVMAAGGLAAVAGLGACATSSTPGRGGGGPGTVLVIGAGVAGLAAARRLARAGARVQVIEGRQRIGGRLWTSDDWPGIPTDLGASWIHGIKGNPITSLAAKAGVRTVQTSYDSGVAFDATGRQLDRAGEAEVARTSKRVFKALAKGQDAKVDRSVRDSVYRGLGWANLSEHDKRLTDFVMVGGFETEYAGSVDELSTWWVDSDKVYPGPDVLLPSGYSQIAEHLANGLSIATGQVVTEIAWGSGGVDVTTTSGRYHGDRAVVTVPLGVLQAGTIRFTPALPAKAVTAVRQLGSGVLNKVFLRFPNVFWDRDVDWIELITAAGQPPWAEWVNLARVTGQPVLLGFAGGALGRQVDGWGDQQVVASAMAAVRTMYGPGVPDPLTWQITRWGADPLARGSYSFNALGSNPRMRTTLAKPISDRIFLAGEATERYYFGTVHGAYRSGIRAAKQVLST